MRKQARIFCYGDLCMEVVAETESGIEPPAPDASLRELSATVGGAALKCATAAARQGAEVHLIGNLGRDAYAGIIASYLAENKIGAEYVATLEGATGTVLSLRRPGGENGMYSFRGVNAESCGSLPATLERADILYLSGDSFQDAASHETLAELKTRAQAAGAMCVLDPSFQFASTFRKHHKDALRGIQVVFPNLAEARLMTGFRAPIDCACSLRDSGARVAVLTLGAGGCYIDSSQYRGTIPTREVETAGGTTGAGDAFCGAMLAALSRGATPREAAGEANEYAGRVVESFQRA